MAENPISGDPLAVLGSEVFFGICQHLPFGTLTRLPSVCKAWRDFSDSQRSGLWRSACRRHGVNSKRLAELQELESSTHARGTAAADESQSGSGKGLVDWMEVCKEQLLPDIHWRAGNFKDFFVERILDGEYGSRGVVDTYAIDEEDETSIILTAGDGIFVVNTKTRGVLFVMPSVCPGTQMGFCRGFFAVRAYAGDFRFRIFRTRNAIARSANPWAAATALVNEAAHAQHRQDRRWLPESVLRPEPYSPKQKAPAPIDRGCLAYYRDVIMPVYGGVSRMRVMEEGTDNERVLLAVVGDSKVYLWDLDDAEADPEIVDCPEPEREPKSIDFNQYVIFLASTARLDIVSRSAGILLYAFPPDPKTTWPMRLWAQDIDSALKDDRAEHLPQGRVVYSMKDDEDHDLQLGGPGLSHLVELPGYGKGDPRYEALILKLELLWESPSPLGWLACHPAGADLVYAHRSGQLLLTRGYSDILSLPDTTEKGRKWAEQTIVLQLDRRIKRLSVHGTRVAVGTDRNILFFDTDRLPHLPGLSANSSGAERASGIAPIRVRRLLRLDPLEEIIGDPQIHSTVMYTTKLAAGFVLGVRGLDFGSQVGR